MGGPGSCGQSGSHGWSGSHQLSCSRRHTRSHRRCLLVDQQEQVPSVVATPGTLQRGEPPPTALSDPGGRSPLRNVALERVPWPVLRCPTKVSQWEGTLVPNPLLTHTLNTFWEGTHPGRGAEEEGPPVRPVAQTPPGWPLQVDWVAWPICGYPGLVGRAMGDARCRGPLTACLEGKGLLWGAYGEIPGWKWEKWLLHPASSAVYLERIGFCHPWTPRMGSQDFCLGQPRKTWAYAKAVQYRAEKVKPLLPGKPCQLAESVLELRQAMEPLTTFQDSEVLGDDTIPCSMEVCHTILSLP